MSRKFLLTRLLRGATFVCMKYGIYCIISTHTPLARRDFLLLRILMALLSFLLTRLLRGATCILLILISIIQFLLTRLLRGATACCDGSLDAELHFYSHASCEARPLPKPLKIIFNQFLLTRLLRGATKYHDYFTSALPFLLTRLLRGATWISHNLSPF